MKNTIAFIFALLVVGISGIGWGFYEYQIRNGLTTPETINIIKEFVGLPARSEQSESIQQDSNSIEPDAEEITPVVDTPIITPTKIELRRLPPAPKPLVKKEAQGLVDEGNKFYDEGIKHIQNTFKKDSTFDKENNLAIEKLREALRKYSDAEKIDGDSLWLRNRIRETNGNLVTCRKQARRQ